jgi:hypothetical protein
MGEALAGRGSHPTDEAEEAAEAEAQAPPDDRLLMPATLWTPDSTRPKKRVRLCLTCGREYPLAHINAFARHVESCAAGKAEEHVKAQQSNVFESFAEPDVRKWISKRLAEGKPATKRGRPV